MRFFLFCCFSLIILCQTEAQQDSFQIIYGVDSSSTLDMSKEKGSFFVFECPYELPIDTVIKLQLSIGLGANKTTIIHSCKTMDIGDGRRIISGILPQPLLDINTEGHLSFGKAIIKHFYDQKDSLVPIQSQTVFANDITGDLYLDFSKGAGDLAYFMGMAEYTYWLDLSHKYQDTLQMAKKDSVRAVAILSMSKENKIKKEKEAAITTENLNQFSEYKQSFEAIRSADNQVNTGIEKVKNGANLSQKEMMAIADATGQRHKLSKELEKKDINAFEAFQSNSNSSKDLDLATKQEASAQQMLSERQTILRNIHRKIKEIQKEVKRFEKKYKN